MGWSLRIDVFEGEGVFVLVNLFGGDFTGDDAAEQAVVHGNPVWIFKIPDGRL
jgi:hypothetical protein